jgi:enoyl-CoA hydratase
MSTEPTTLANDCETVRLTTGQRHENVATVELHRPESRNAMNEQLRRELTDLLCALEDDESSHVIVLTGAAEGRAFCAGADIHEVKDRDGLTHRELNHLPRVYETIDRLDTPVIARINGHALGGGCELVLASDIRIARAGVKIGQTEINLGIMPGGGATQRLPRLVGEGQALKLILTGEPVDSGEAERIGLVDETLETDFDDRVTEIASSIADKSPLVVQFARKAVEESRRMNLDQGLEYEAELAAQLFDTEDQTEGFEAFIDDREPEWQGR